MQYIPNPLLGGSIMSPNGQDKTRHLRPDARVLLLYCINIFSPVKLDAESTVLSRSSIS